jgi:DNA-binding NarL/FixJ family response regulator
LPLKIDRPGRRVRRRSDGPAGWRIQYRLQLSRDAAVGLALRETPAAAPTATSNAGGLSQRETDVARLVTEGLSDKDIGARLFISERTVESHVRNILTKLGFTTRTQIAGWLAAQATRQP